LQNKSWLAYIYLGYSVVLYYL